MADSGVPDLARLWRLPTAARPGRPAALDVDRVVSTAVELADREGLSGATLPRIAAALSVTPMSLYRHIGSKQALNDLMADAGLGPPPGLAPGPWRPALRSWAVAQLAVHQRHPWLTQLPISGPPSGPHAIAWTDAGLRTLRDTALDWPAKVGVISVASGYVRQAFITSRQLQQARRAANLDEAQALRNYARDLAGLVTSQRFPDAAALFAAGVFDAPEMAAESPDEDFHFGLELVLDGVAAAVSAAKRRGGQ